MPLRPNKTKIVTTIGDLPDPKMRIGNLGPERTQLEAGNRFILTTEHMIGDAEPSTNDSEKNDRMEIINL